MSLLSWMAPQWALKRAAARQVLAAYEASKPTRTHKPKRSAATADMNVQLAGKSLREQCRHLDENHDLVTGLFDRLEERVVGGPGIGVEPIPMSLTGEVHTELAEQIKAAWSEWSLSPEASGQFTRPQVERHVCRTWLRDGECLAQLLIGQVPNYKHLSAVPFALELIEPDYLPFDLNEESKGILQGIQRNSWRRITAFHLLKSNPASLYSSLSMTTKSVPAEMMLYIAHRKRFSQNRGVPMLHSTLIRLAEIKDYEESERVAARISAALAMYIKRGTPDMYTPPQSDSRQDRTFQIAPGIVFDTLEPGEEVGMIESNRPNTFLESFRNGQLRAVAATSRLGFSTLARNYNGTYSAQRQELVEAQLGYDLLQHEFIDAWCRPVYRKWLATALASGQITMPLDVDPASVFAAVYQGPVMPWIDPRKEADAWEILVAAGFADEAEVARARGRNPQEMKKNRAAEIKTNRDEGLVFSSDAYHQYYGAKDNAETTKRAFEPDGSDHQGAGE